MFCVNWIIQLFSLFTFWKSTRLRPLYILLSLITYLLYLIIFLNTWKWKERCFLIKMLIHFPMAADKRPLLSNKQSKRCELNCSMTIPISTYSYYFHEQKRFALPIISLCNIMRCSRYVCRRNRQQWRVDGGVEQKDSRSLIEINVARESVCTWGNNTRIIDEHLLLKLASIY